MWGIIKALSSSFIKNITVVVGGVLVLTILFLWWSNNGLDRENLKLTQELSALSQKNSILQGQFDSLKKSFDAATEARKEQHEVYQALTDTEESTIKFITKIEKEVANGEANIRNTLPDALKRLLYDHCSRVQGSTCNDP